MTLDELRIFARQQQLMTISTVSSENKPESALVGFAWCDDDTIVFATRNTSRKAANLLVNPQVALVIGWEKGATAQIEGTAQLVTDASEIEKAKNQYKTYNDFVASRWDRVPDAQYYICKPTWVRYTAVTQNPWVVEEIAI